MRVHRGYLFWGIFFVLLGGIPLAERLGWLDPDRADLTGRIWPLIIIAVGIAILSSRSRAALVGTVVVAMVLGIICGSVLAWSTRWVTDLGDCTVEAHPSLQTTTQSGTLTGAAAVELVVSCGTLDVTPAGDSGWDLQARHHGDAPAVQSSASQLAVRTASGSGRQEWTLHLPVAAVGTLSVTASGTQTHLDVDGAQLASLVLVQNAGNAVVSAAGTTIDSLDATVNASTAAFTLGGTTTGHIVTNAGSVDVCVPANATLQLRVPDHLAFDTNLDERQLTQQGDTWTRPGAGGPTITLTVEGNAAEFELDPAGGCG